MSQRLFPTAALPAKARKMCYALVAPALLASLGACSVDRMATGTTAPGPDYWTNHPIAMAEAPTLLEVFPGPGKIDRVSDMALKAFAAGYKSRGVGQIEVLFPQGAVNEASLRASMPEIRRSLASAGVNGYLSVGNYPVRHPENAAPIRLSYRELKAKVATKCGEWPTDLASAVSLEGMQNRPYWNFGCSYQTMYATQVDDPRDLVGPRAETPPDVEMRRHAIEKVRAGGDPSTSWSVSVGGVGG